MVTDVTPRMAAKALLTSGPTEGKVASQILSWREKFEVSLKFDFM